MTLLPSPASAAAPAESGDIDCWAAIGSPDSAPAQNFQAPSSDRKRLLTLVPPSPSAPPRPQRLEVRFHVLDGRSPFGRAGPFRLSESDVDELIAAAMRLERRA
jgi:hypothetical protein